MDTNLKPYIMETRRPIDRDKKERIITSLTAQPNLPPRPTAKEIGAAKKLRIIERLAAQPDTPTLASKNRATK